MASKSIKVALTDDHDPGAREGMADSALVTCTTDPSQVNEYHDGGTAGISIVEMMDGAATKLGLTMSLGLLSKSAEVGQRLCDGIINIAKDLELLEDGGFDYVGFIIAVYKLGQETSWFDVYVTKQDESVGY